MWQSIYAADLEWMKPLTKACRCLFLALVILMVQSASVVSACSPMASAPHSRWQVTAQDGVFWLLTPCGERFFSIGVNALNGGYPARLFQGRVAYHWGHFYADLDAWGQSAHRRMVDWGFNTAGAWSLDPPKQLKLPVIPDLELG